MKIHIPSHLEKLEIVSQLKRLLLEYAKTNSTTDTLDNFESYLTDRSLDPVKRFLMICINDEKISDSIDYENLIDYYTTKFFSFRGTLSIFKFLDEIKEKLGISIIDYTYTIHTLTVDFGEVTTSDINLFTSSAVEFFKALLYFQDYIDTLETMRLELTAYVKITLSDGCFGFSEYFLEEEYEEQVN